MKNFIILVFSLIAVQLNSQTALRQADYNANNNKSTNALTITPITTLAAIANYLSGPGVTINNVKFNGNSNGIIGNLAGYYQLTGNTPSFGIDTGIVIATGGISGAIGPNTSPSTTTPSTYPYPYIDSSLQALVPTKNITEGAVIEFDFIPLTDTIIACKFVFGSEEYPEFVNTQFNDVFGFFISGANPFGGTFNDYNLAVIPGTNLPITIDNLNANVNSQFYIDNIGGQTLQYDGYTTPILLQQVVIPGQTYHFKVGISDCGDNAYDSGVFMKIKSFYGYASMPIANFNSNINGNSVTFDNTTNWAKFYVWDYGDGIKDTVYTNNTSITHNYTSVGSYDVILEAHNYYQIDTVMQTIQIGNVQVLNHIQSNSFEMIQSINPNSYDLHINLNRVQDVTISIADISGQIVKIIPIHNKEEIYQNIDLSNLSKGVYILKVNTKEKIFVKKLINR